MQNRIVTQCDVLRAKEERSFKQKDILKNGKGLISFTMVIPGNIKASRLISKSFSLGVQLIDEKLRCHGISVKHREILSLFTGNEGYWLFDANPEAIKRAMIEIEDRYPLGRLFDIDVIAPNLSSVSRISQNFLSRRCLVCDAPAHECSRSEKHSKETLISYVNQMMLDYFTNKEKMKGRIAMKEKILELIPEIKWIKSEELQEKVIATYEDALKIGNWDAEDMDKIPFTLLIPQCPFSYLSHVRGVTKVAKDAMEGFNEIYATRDSKFTLDHDTLIAGAILHDVGKLVEYEKTDAGEVVKSQMGKDLRHPFSGTSLALKHGFSTQIGHIIANHAAEGDGTLRSPEAVIVNKADFINFETVKSFLGMK